MKNVFAPLVIAVLIASAINQGLFFLAREVFGEGFSVDLDGTGAQPAFAVLALAPAVFTVFQGIVGGVIVARIALQTARPQTNWVWLALLGLALSVVPTAFAAAGVASTFLWLSLMHLVAGALIIPSVARALPTEKAGVPKTGAPETGAPEGFSPAEN